MKREIGREFIAARADFVRHTRMIAAEHNNGPNGPDVDVSILSFLGPAMVPFSRKHKDWPEYLREPFICDDIPEGRTFGGPVKVVSIKTGSHGSRKISEECLPKYAAAIIDAAAEDIPDAVLYWNVPPKFYEGVVNGNPLFVLDGEAWIGSRNDLVNKTSN